MGFEVTNSFLEEFDFMFHPFLKQQGSALLMATTQEAVTGSVKYIRQSSVGEAGYIDTVGGITDYAPIKFDRRMLKPKAFACPIMLDDVDMVMQGTPDVGMLAADAANSCGKMIDNIIIKALGGLSYSEGHGEIDLPDTQYVVWDEKQLEEKDATNRNPVATTRGLSAAKVAQAVRMLREKFNSGPLVCVASEYAMSTLRADSRVANTLFNTQPSLATGLNTPYGGCDAFIPCQLVDTGTSKSTTGSNVEVEYAYIYALNQIKLGISKPLDMKYGKNAERYLNNTLIYWGMYGCTRMFEEAVVRIEINKSLS